MRKFSSTTKVSSRRSSRSKHLRLILAVGASAVAAYYVLPRLLFFIASVLMLPVLATQSWLAGSSGAIPEFVRDRTNLIEEIESLEIELAAQAEEDERLLVLERENEELRSLLGANEEERILAGVVARPNQLPYDVILLDRGSNEGVKVGAPVYVGDQTVIGYIHKTTPQTALVTLITTPGFVSTVFVFGPNIYTNAVGQGGGQVRVGVPQGITIQEGDVVVLPTMSTGIYGAVTHVESHATQPEQYGYVSPAIPLSELRLVTVGAEPVTPVGYDTAKENVEAQYSNIFTVPVPEGVLVTLKDTASTSTSTLDSLDASGAEQ